MKKDVVVHHIRMGDVEDPDLFVAQPIYEWQQTDKGKWVMKHSNPAPIWHRNIDHYNYGWSYTITATFSGRRLTEYYLRWE
jgi:hypothetical protein